MEGKFVGILEGTLDGILVGDTDSEGFKLGTWVGDIDTDG